MSANEVRDAQADAHAMIDALLKVDPQAVLVVRFIAGRMLAGYEAYGRLDIATDKRDFDRERALELGDLLTYSAMAELRRVLAGETLKNGHPEPLDLLRAVFGKDHNLSQAERAYLAALILHANNESWTCFPSQPTLASEAGGKQRRAKDILKSLEGRGLVTRSVRPAQRKGQFDGTIYTLSPGAIIALGKNCRGQDSQATGGNPCTPPGATIAPYLLNRTAQGELPISASRAAGTKAPTRSVKKGRLKKPAPEGYLDVLERYYALFEAARGEKPILNGPAIAAMNRFARELGRDKAIEKLERIFASTNTFWRTKATIIDIARDPDKFTAPPANGTHRRVEVQRDGYDAAKSEQNAAYILEQRKKAEATP